MNPTRTLDTDTATGPELTGAITTHEQLRSVLGEPSEGARRKDIGRLDEHCRAFIARSPFLLIGTAGAAGFCDVSPRGDLPGFAHVLDERTLALPERPGNKRGDTLANIIDNPQAGLIFLVPGIEETLRVNGHARIVQDEELLASMAVQGRPPKLAIVLDVREAYFHCAKAFRRSKLWDPAAHVPRSELPSLGRVLYDQLSIDSCTVEQLDDDLEKAYRATLY
jgi:PPOX class probable FMN-dependent enzyme